MNNTKRYIEIILNSSKAPKEQAVSIIKHWQNRYELGTAVILCKDPEAVLKTIKKQWNKQARQLQSTRETTHHANEILEITKTISRMQRIKFSTELPERNPEANFYVLDAKNVTSLPAKCYTLYAPEGLPEKELLNKLAPEALVVAYGPVKDVPANLYAKLSVEQEAKNSEKDLVDWLKTHKIDITRLDEDMENCNDALDTILSSSRLCSEFIHKTQTLSHTINLAQPFKLSSSQLQNLKSIERLEQYVKLLSPVHNSKQVATDHSEDSFLLRDLTTIKLLTLESLKQFVVEQYRVGRNNLAKALEQETGYINI
jgi:hypothetical protein